MPRRSLSLAWIAARTQLPEARVMRLDGRIVFGNRIWLNMQIFPLLHLSGEVGGLYFG
jgi:hypothetical protein